MRIELKWIAMNYESSQDNDRCKGYSVFTFQRDDGTEFSLQTYKQEAHILDENPTKREENFSCHTISNDLNENIHVIWLGCSPEKLNYVIRKLDNIDTKLIKNEIETQLNSNRQLIDRQLDETKFFRYKNDPQEYKELELINLYKFENDYRMEIWFKTGNNNPENDKLNVAYREANLDDTESREVAITVRHDNLDKSYGFIPNGNNYSVYVKNVEDMKDVLEKSKVASKEEIESFIKTAEKMLEKYDIDLSERNKERTK